MQDLQRICFQLQVKPERIEEYRARHAAVWPDMLQALHETGWRNYSLFLRDDGLLIGYFETVDLQSALDGMARTEVNRRWQTEMSPLFEDLDGAAPDTGFVVLNEVFNLDEQLNSH
ncbi:MAG TPA: L-rhamnose mutarotase [Naasia sp.]|jgi:L-rhamnose mutarotase